MSPRGTLACFALLVGLAPMACSLIDLSGLTGDVSEVSSDGGRDSSLVDADPEAAACPPGVDFATDPKNCGRCGHDCLGGACTVARCQPVAFLVDAGFTAGVAADGTELFWSTPAGDIRATLLDGGGPIRQIAKLPAASHIDLDDQFVYTATATNLRIVRVPKAGGGLVESLATCTGICYGIAVAGAAVYYTDRGTQTARLVGVDGGTAIATGLSNPEDLSVVGTDLFVANEGGNTIVKVPRAGGASSVFLTLPDPVSMAVDGDDLWIVSQGPGIVYRRPLSGGFLDAVATMQKNPTGLILTPNAAYWASGAAGSIMRLAR